jgi:dUTP pyrophosphatase
MEESYVHTSFLVHNLKIMNKSGYQLKYATEGSIGFDLHATIPMKRIIEPNRRWLADTGLHIELPSGLGALVLPRSGITANHGVVAVPGVIDTDFRGQIKVNLFNHGLQPYEVMPGDRIAQLVLIYVPKIVMKEVESLSETIRGDSGFGSSGR